MSDDREARLERVRRVAKVVGILDECEDAQEFGAPCFVECYCWDKAERIVNAKATP